MYSKIYEFCKVRNLGSVYKNDSKNPTPRVNYLISLLRKEGINYELDTFKSGFVENSITCYNIILKGSSSKMIVAHHDIVNPNIDNANDNSASVINAIMVKKLMPDINVVLLDGEEMGGLGSKRVSEQIKQGYFGIIEWVLNLELTGKGGENFFIGDYQGNLFNHIISIFNCPVFKTPFNDSVIFRKNGIDSCVINPLPILKEGMKSSLEYNGKFLDHGILFNCHSERDSLDSIDIDDMKNFVEKVLLKILN
jgi:hypothetical protein